MEKELEHQVQLERVVNYYKKAQKFYEAVWYRRGFGLHYGFWTSEVNSRDEAILEENQVLADMVKIKSGDLVLDAGCGVGGSGVWLAKNRQVKVVGINIVRDQLNRGKKIININNVQEKSYLTNADYQRLPFFNRSFDVFWSLESIEHSDNVSLLISEAFRVLKKGGRAVIAGTFKGSTIASDIQKNKWKLDFVLQELLMILKVQKKLQK